MSYYIEHERELRSLLTGETASGLQIDTFVNTEDKNQHLPFDKMRTTTNYDLPDAIYGIGSGVEPASLDALGIFLRIHLLLKQCRNAFNHGDSERPKLPQILKLANLYVDYAEYLYEHLEV